MAKSLKQLNLPLKGMHYRGIDDARNIARSAQQLLPHIGASTTSPKTETAHLPAS